MSQRSTKEAAPSALPIANPYLAAVLAWLVPGLGHVFLRRRGRGLIFFLIILGALGLGVSLKGNFPWTFGGSPLAILATLGGMGSGLPYLILGLAVGYRGDVGAAGYEYGGAFILTAGLMNLLLVIDAWDLAWGKEEALGDEEEEAPQVENDSESARKDEAAKSRRKRDRSDTDAKAADE